MDNIDVRWQQRLNNYIRALLQLTEAMEPMQQRELSKLEKQGVIQCFKHCYELGWNTLEDFLVWQSIESVVGSRDTIHEAFGKGLSSDGHAWMQCSPTATVPRIRSLDQANASTLPRVTEAILYGTRSKGNYRPGSDIDPT